MIVCNLSSLQYRIIGISDRSLIKCWNSIRKIFSIVLLIKTIIENFSCNTNEINWTNIFPQNCDIRSTQHTRVRCRERRRSSGSEYVGMTEDMSEEELLTLTVDSEEDIILNTVTRARSARRSFKHKISKSFSTVQP